MDPIVLPYGNRSLEIPFEADAAEAEIPAPLADLSASMEKALLEPRECAALPDMLPSSGRVSVLVSDLTRGRTAASLLREILKFLERYGAGPPMTSIVIAGGMHRGQTEAEIGGQLGDDIARRYTIIQHDARDRASLVDAGLTSSGTRCLFNRHVAESDLVIGAGAVSFHYFAGFGGGRKLILPGISGEETIIANHRRSLRDDPAEGLAPGCGPGRLDRNPVHVDMLDGASRLPAPVFMVCAVPGAGGIPAFVSAGDMDAAHRLAASKLMDLYSLPVGRRRKAVIASAGGYPKDMNLLQSHKAIRHASLAVEDGGLLLIAASCEEGIGSDSLEETFSAGIGQVPLMVREKYTLNSQAAMSIVEITERIEVRLHSTLPDETLRNYGFRGWVTAGTASLLEGLPGEDILVLTDPASFLPVSG